MSTHIPEGWLENSAVIGSTRRRYDHYIGLITAWGTNSCTRPELAELPLLQR